MIQPTTDNCPVLADTNKIIGLSDNMKKTMQKLRRDLKHCEGCIAGEHCAILQDYQAKITGAISSVLSELEYLSN